MIIIIGLIILVAALVVGVAGVLGNGGSAHALGHFSVLGYHVTGSAGTLFLYGIVVGAAGLLGLSLLLAGAPPHRTAWQNRETRAQAVPARDRCGQGGARRPDRPARHCPRPHRQHAGQRHCRPTPARR